MAYNPVYCCSCGEKIERIERNWLTNRRFCEVCETEHPLDKILTITVPLIILVSVIFGINGYLQSGNSADGLSEIRKSADLKNDFEQEKSADVRTLKSADKADLEISNDRLENRFSDVQTKSAKSVTDRRSAGISETQEVFVAKSPQNKSGGKTYFCGAETKKGTPCSRKVKGGGRCFQHKDREAMLPDKELAVENY